MMTKANIPSTDKPESQTAGRPLNLEESQSRLSRLVKGEGQQVNLGRERTGSRGQEFREQISSSSEQIREEEEDQDQDHIVAEAPVAAAPPKATTADTSDDQSADNGLLTQEEEKKAAKANLKDALRWLYTWLQRKRKKSQLIK